MKMIFHTAPNTCMELSKYGTDTFYILGQEYVKSEEYRQYTKQAIADGRFTILDSGMGDHGDFLQNEQLFELVKELHPNEVIPTDNLYDSEKTIANTMNMAKMLDFKGITDTKIFMCPQGKSIDDYIKCWKWAVEAPFVATIGMSKKTVPYVIAGEASDQAIGKCRNIMYDILKVRGLITKPVHMLGSEGPQEYIHYKGDDMIRSTDSCVAIWAAMNGQFIGDPNYKRISTPADYFTRNVSQEDHELAIRNMEYFNEKVLQ